MAYKCIEAALFRDNNVYGTSAIQKQNLVIQQYDTGTNLQSSLHEIPKMTKDLTP